MTDSERAPLRRLPLTAVTIDDDFWSPRREVNRDVTVDHQYEQLEAGGCLDNFRRAAGDGGEFEGMWFEDSDAYKWIEAASYAQASEPTPERRERLDRVVSLVAAAQEPDGYLDTYFQLVEPDRKWTNLAMMHELYCAGHLIEAAVAHHEVTGGTSLLDVALALADHVDGVFGPDGRDGVPGHEGIELALVELSRVTGERRYLDLAEFFVDRRGAPDSRLKWETLNLDEIAGSADVDEGTRSVFLDDDGAHDRRYAQDHAPLRQQSTAEGHAVRAMYLYSGATDLLLAGAGDEELREALERLWENVTTRRSYVTGGIGPERAHEGFTDDYDLPNATAYAETCAAVGSVMWNERMARLTGESRFVDALETALYNGFLAGVSLDGTEFFYENPLESDGDHHRAGWFDCACCPPNVARLLASLERYVYAAGDGAAYVDLFVEGWADVDIGGTAVTLSQWTDYPWDGDVTVEVEAVDGSAGTAEFDLNLRLPGWCDDPSLAVNGDPVPIDATGGYATLDRKWRAGDTVALSLPMPVERLVAHPEVEADAGRVALRRGPLVYCLEGVDNDRPLHHLRVPTDSDVTAEFDEDLLGGVTVLSGDAVAPRVEEWADELYRPADDCEVESASFTAVPYYAWDNREASAMRVWVDAAKGR
ncbi:glycoside hydrolase family 127 protein [Halorarum halophilum]|uniref:Glycoside hydrolase family 127 protein n=1 Tax=Halorarum halophilum TaxID=2743090 RepID=A0A7D5GFJ7_9EURY|nr:beta-L-arabinofuranosidase domain-containing protein [Halobaculum halophilum]QLG27810.1 glycoside hydrolase family 127 protein [Halobaculum halophilum]